MIEFPITLTSGGSVCMPGYVFALALGYTKNRGVYRLAVTASGEWEGLTIRCFWHVPDGKDPSSSLVVDGYVAVPASVTAQPGSGCITFEGSDGAKVMTSADLRYRVSANSGTEDGTEPEPGTPAWQQLVDAVHTDATAAEQAKTDAQTAAQQAGASAQKAGNALSDTITAKEDALKATKDAQTAASEAATSAGSADQSAQEAADSLQELKDGIAAGDFKGEPGNDGKSPVVTVTDIENGHRVSITDKDGTKTIDVLNGKDGKDAPQIDDTTVTDSAPWSSKHLVDMLCPPLDETGNPVVCYPVVGYPLGCKVSLEPMQEGSGTPYPAGGGKNLFNPAWMPEKTLNNGLTWTTTSDGTVTANGTANGTSYYNSNHFSLPAGTYTISAMSHFRISVRNLDAGDTTIVAQVVGKPCTFTVENDIQNASLFFAVSGILDNVSAKPQIEKGTTATAYAPYENIRPIKGRDSVTVERCGENLLNIAPFTKLTNKGITYEYVATGGVHISGTATAAVDSPIFAVGHLPPGKYYGLDVGTGASASIVVQRNGANLWLHAEGVFEILAGDVIKYWYMIATNGATLDTTVYPYIVPGTTAPTTYAPYTGQTATLTLPRTIYGGTVDAVTGEGNENAKIITLDGNELKFTKANIYINLPAHSAPGISKGGIICCSHFNRRLFAVNTTYEFCFLLESDMTSLFASVDDLNAYLAAQYAAGTPVQIAYKLAEPVPITATGSQPIPALSGVNTILTDADSATVTGRADPIKRITDLEDAVASMT